jgi:hypothetical protein
MTAGTESERTTDGGGALSTEPHIQIGSSFGSLLAGEDPRRRSTDTERDANGTDAAGGDERGGKAASRRKGKRVTKTS